jgi:hypothetical protein
MNRRAVRGVGGFTDRFRERRMRVDRPDQLFHGALEAKGQDSLGYELG